MSDIAKSDGQLILKLMGEKRALMDALRKCLEPTAPQTKWFNARALLAKLDAEAS